MQKKSVRVGWERLPGGGGAIAQRNGCPLGRLPTGAIAHWGLLPIGGDCPFLK